MPRQPDPADTTTPAAAEAQAMLDGIVAISAEAIICIDEAHCITVFNRGATAIFGYAAAEVLGQPLAMLLPERFRASHAGHITGFGSAESPARHMADRREIFGLAKGGREFPAAASISQFVSAGRRTFTVVLRDVSAWKEAEAALRRANEELEARVARRTAELMAAIDAIPDGFVVMDPNRYIRLANSAMSALVGYSNAELRGAPMRRLLATAEDDRAVAAGWQKQDDADAKPGSSPVQVGCRRKDGSTFTAIAYGNVVRAADGAVAGHVALVRDITEDLARQRALQQSQKMEAVGQLAGGIAHDFNNLLTVIIGNLELLEMRLVSEPERRLLKPVQEAAESGARLTGRLLAYSRRQPPDAEVVAVNALVVRISELLRRTLGEHITLTTTLIPDALDILADASQVESALMNLAINARDAMPDGGRLLIETRNVEIGDADLRSGLDLVPGAYVAIAVCDTGGGIAPEIRDRVFEPFFTTKEPGRGTGLGLSMVYGFVKRQHGAVTIDSEPGHGTTVTLYLPGLVGQAKAGRGRRPAPDAAAPAARDILLVEDDAEVRELNRARLEQLGYRVVEARTGVEALRAIESGLRPDLVFSDMIMPGGMTGLQLYQRARAIIPDLRFLLTSGNADDAAGDGGSASPPCRMLAKPYRLGELAAAVREALE